MEKYSIIKTDWNNYNCEQYEAFKFYTKIHYALIPYIYSFAHIGASTRMPVVRAIPLMYPDDDNASNNIYLPEGKWIDYFTV